MNDVNLLLFVLDSVSLIGVFALTFVASVFLHEVGHLLVLRKNSKTARVYFNKIGGKLKLRAGKEEDYLNLSQDQLENVYIAGIFLGAVPVSLFWMVNSWGVVLIVVYLLGCRSDFKKLQQIKLRE